MSTIFKVTGNEKLKSITIIFTGDALNYYEINVYKFRTYKAAV